MFRRFTVAAAFFWLLSAVWVFATPLGGAPDEPAHIIRAAAASTGQVITPAWSGNVAYGAVEVPESIASLPARTCFAFDPSVTPACFSGDAGGQELVETGTSAALNSPLYYWLVGWPVHLLSGDALVYAMRLASAALCALVYGAAAAFLPLPRGRVPWALLGAATAVTPMTAFLAGSVNPNAIEAVSAVTLLVSARSVLRGEVIGRGHAAWVGASASVALVLLINSRSIGFLWALVIAVLVVSDAGRSRSIEAAKSPLVRRTALVALAPVVASALWLAALPDYDQSGTPTIEISAAGAAARALLGSAELAGESIGLFGWMDTPAPAASVFGHCLAVALLLAMAVVGAHRRAAILPVALVIAAVVIPPVVQFVIADELGYIWQGRYTLALVLCAIVGLGMAAESAPQPVAPRRARMLAAVLIGALVVSHVASGLVVLRRYVTGTGAPWSDLIMSPIWQPPLGWPVLLGALLVIVCSAAAVLLRASLEPSRGRRTNDSSTTQAPSDSPGDLPDHRSEARGTRDIDREPDIMRES